jgi:DNA-binding FadR family transcriptional regulator
MRGQNTGPCELWTTGPDANRVLLIIDAVRKPVAVLSGNYDLLQLLEVRHMLEPRAAALAAVHAGARQLRETELAAQAANPNDHGVLEKHDFLFHDAILRAAENPILGLGFDVISKRIR